MGMGNVTIHYVTMMKRTNRLQCDALTFQVRLDAVTEWIQLIEEKRKDVSGKPRKLLVIINPIGGKGQGRQIFEKQVQPLFELAGIETIVKVTDHFRHGVEIATSFDLTSVDGVAVSGGDGLFAEVLQGILLQTQSRAGVDVNDPEASLQPSPIHIAHLPTGTGNGISGWINGDVIDVVTATLNIVRGKTTRINLLTIHDEGKLVHYCALRLAYGFFAQLMKRTDEKRWMKRARYPYALLTSVFWQKHLFDVEVDILQLADVQQGDGDTSPKWKSLGRKSISNLLGWTAGFELSEEERMVFNPFSPYADLILHTSTSGFHHLGFLFKMILKKKDMFDNPSIERYERVVGFKFRYVGERPPLPSASSQTEGQGASPAASVPEKTQLNRLLDIDGELQDSEVSAVDCRLVTSFVPVYGVQYVPT